MRIFEHLVEINEPRLPGVQLGRGQLWAGLVLRAEEPLRFVEGLEAARITDRREVGGCLELDRELDFGSFRVRDTVVLTAPSESLTRVTAGETWPASTLLVRIEEPEPGRPFLRFIYEADESGSAAPDEVTRRLRQQAYQELDLDTVRRIRALAEQGALGDGPGNS
jgi:hypothetical protein